MKNPFGRRVNRQSSNESNNANTSNDNRKDDMELKPGATHDSEGTDNHHHHHHNNNHNNKTTNGSTNTNNNNHRETDVWDVVIIGAGWAGIGAGRYLWDQCSSSKKQQPPKVCILEAAPHIGGRSRTLVLPATSDHDAFMVEMGSQWIHGLDRRRNLIYQLALKHKDEQLFKLHYDRGDDDWLHGKPAIWRDTISPQNNDDNDNDDPKSQTKTQRMDAKTIQELGRKMTQGKHGFFAFLNKYPNKQQKQWKAQQRKNKKQQKSTNDATTNSNSNDINSSNNNKPPSVSVQHVLDEYARIQNLSPEDQRFLQYLVEMNLTLEYGASLEDIDATFWDHDLEYKGGDLHFGLVQQPSPNQEQQKQRDDTPQPSSSKKSTSTLTTNQSATTFAGYSALIEKYAAPIRDQFRCHCLVTSIDYSDKDSSLVLIEYLQVSDNNHSDNSNNINADNMGEQPETGAQPSSSTSPTVHRMLARTVLCTVPLGVLKAEQIKFTPPLPPPKRLAIERLGMGTYNKVALIWKPEQREHLPWLFSLEESLSKRQQNDGASKSRKANSSNSYNKNDATDEQGKATHRMWMQRVNLPGEPLGPWTVCYNAHTHHQGPKSPVVLYFFLGGRVAQQVERLSDKEIQEQAMESLREWFNDGQIPDPHNIIVTRWDQDPLACGSYSFYQVGSSPKDRQELTKPIDQKIFFAGEANHVQYYATTHGALMTGHDAAKLIWNSLGRMQRRQKLSKRRSKR